MLPAGTISLTTYFHADQQQLDALGGDYVLASAHANRFSRGHFDQSAEVWSRDGALLATTHQIVYFKACPLGGLQFPPEMSRLLRPDEH